MEEIAAKKAPARWTTEEEALLIAAYRGGLAMEEIAKTHDRSVGAVTSRLHALDMIDYGPYTGLIAGTYEVGEAPEGQGEKAGKHWEDEDVLKLLNAHKTGGNAEALVALSGELGRTPRSLALKLVHLGIVEGKPNANPSPIPRVKPVPKASDLVKKLKLPTQAPAKLVKITVTPEFQTAAKAVLDGENLLILGSAGTGKSTFLKWLRKQLNGQKKYAVLGPTGMAALQVNGQTIHSFFGLKPQLMMDSDAWRKPRNPKLYAALDLVIIDEISMVRADVFSTLDRFLRHYGPDRKKPFGGVQMVLMGDLCQLPPVVRNEERYVFEEEFTSPFFFGSPSWESGNFGVVSFTHIFRQEDHAFVNLLNRVRMGEKSPDLLEALNSRTARDVPEDAVILAARNRTVDAINERELNKLQGEEFEYLAKMSGNAEPNAFTTPPQLILKVGAHVMFTRNDPDQRWVNGTVGVVTACRSDDVTVEVNGEEHVVEKVTWETVKYDTDAADNPVAVVAGSYTQLPLTLAWALTIHKAQGQTLEHCLLDLSDGGAFAEGQLYVALSRAKSLEGLYLATPIRPGDIKVNPQVLGFYQGLGLAAVSGT